VQKHAVFVAVLGGGKRRRPRLMQGKSGEKSVSCQRSGRKS
jgi:hypothetical protein